MQKGVPIKYPGQPDRQTAVFRWMISEIYCHKDRPLEVGLEHMEILIRSYRNFVLIAGTLGSRPSRQLIHKLTKQKDLCTRVENTLMVHTRDTRVFEAFSINIDLVPVILNLVHGISIEYSEEKRKIEKILDWVAKATIGKYIN